MVRLKRRYFVCAIEVHTDQGDRFPVRSGAGGSAGAGGRSTRSLRGNITRADVFKAIRESVQVNFGDFGVACVSASLQVRDWTPDTGLCIVRGARDNGDALRAAITLVSKVKTLNATIHVVQACGVERSAVAALSKHTEAAF